jgi:hypothetical protein
LQRVISVGSADARIKKICEENGRTPPGDAERHLRKQTNMNMMRVKAEEDLDLSEDASSSKVNESRQNRDGKKPTEGSLEALLTQMDKRMAKMEEKGSQVDELAALLRETRSKANRIAWKHEKRMTNRQQREIPHLPQMRHWFKEERNLASAASASFLEVSRKTSLRKAAPQRCDLTACSQRQKLPVLMDEVFILLGVTDLISESSRT